VGRLYKIERFILLLNSAADRLAARVGERRINSP
jgi:hypothetical protein